MRSQCVKLLLLFLFRAIIICFFLSILSPKTDIDDCASHPCKNNGTCTDRVNGFKCTCTPGFHGTQCETGNLSRYHHQPFNNGSVMLIINQHLIKLHIRCDNLFSITAMFMLFDCSVSALLSLVPTCAINITHAT